MPDETKPAEQVGEQVAAMFKTVNESISTPAQIAAEKQAKALADAKAARIKQVEEIRAKRSELEKKIGQVFTDGEHEAKVTAFEKNNIRTETGWLTDDYFTVNFGNPFVHKNIPCGTFLETFKLKGAE